MSLLGRITQSVYDSRNRLIETIKTDGWSQQMRYDSDNNTTSSLDGNGNRTNRVFDARGRLIREIDPFQKVTIFDYDPANQMIAQIDSNSHKKQFKYDALGRQISVINAPNTPITSTITTEYDKVGNIISVVDGEGNKTEYKYDNQNRQTEVINALEYPGITQTKYDKTGNIVEVTDPAQNTTTFVYDSRNRLKSETNELGKTRSFTYDKVGNKIASIDRNNRRINFVYDQLNRPTQENWLDAVGNVTRTINSNYDSAGQLILLSDPDSTYKFGYDLLGRRISVDNNGTPGVANVLLNYTYDPQGNVISVKDTINGQEKATTAYIYDELNRVKQISQSGNGVANKRVDFDYNSIGQYESVKRYADLNGSLNVVDSDYVYDLKGRLDNLTHKNSATLAFYDFDYDKADRINQIVDIDGTSYYTHDKTSQLTEAVHTDNSKPDEYYNYDANGNRINSSRHSSYGTGENNRLLSDGVYNYEYDDEGNLIRRTEIVSNNVTDYSWDYRNRLVGVSDKNSAGSTLQTVTFAYDGMNRRIKKAVNGSVTTFVYDNENVVLEFGSGGLEQRYLHGTGIDQVLAQENSTSNVVWYLTAHLGTVRDLVNNGGVVNHLSYDSFGNVVSQSNSSFNTRYGFTGRELDSEIGLYFYRGRYYDGTVGRFLSEDPIGFDGGDSNLYRYVGNSPLDHTDPLGLYGSVISQIRVISYNDNGIKITNNIRDVMKAIAFNPNVSIIRDFTFATIIYSQSDTGQPPKETPPNMKPLIDDRGHIVPKALGGDGSINNLFAQNKGKNRGVWRIYEKKVRNYLDDNQPPKCPGINLRYNISLDYTFRDYFFPLRPNSVEGAATFSDGNIIFGKADNP